MAIQSFFLLLLSLVATEQVLVAAKSNICSPNPCANGGKCYARLRGFLCYCKNGFTGPTCRASKWLDVHDYHQLITMINQQQAESKRQQAEIRQQQAESKRQQAEITQQQTVIKQQQADINRLKKATQPCVSSRGVINWKQRAIDSLNSDIDNGHLFSMSFKKQRDDTHLRLTFSSEMRMLTRHHCNNWYFLINGRQCSDPASINGLIYSDVYSGHNNNAHRHNTILGVCRRTSAGIIRAGYHQIAMNIGRCKGAKPGDAYTGWQSTLIMLVEELCPPQ